MVAAVAVSRDGLPVSGLAWLRQRLPGVAVFSSIGGIAAMCTWLAFVTVPGLGTALAAFVGIGSTGTALVSSGVLVLVPVGFVAGGYLSDTVFAEASIGIGALVAGVGALAFVVLPGAFTTAAIALCSIAALGILLPGIVTRAHAGGGPDGLGTRLALVGVGFLLVNAVVVGRWYRLSNWLGLIATSHLLADGVVGIPPRSLVYETFGSWRRALLVVGGSLVAVAGVWFATVGAPPVERLSQGLQTVRESRSDETAPGVSSRRFRQREALAVWFLAAAVAWTVAGGLAVYSGVVDSLEAPIMALAGRLIVVAIIPGLVLGGVAMDRFGTRPVLAAGIAGGVGGPAGYSLAAGPSTDSVAALPPGAPWLLGALLVTGLAVGVLLICLFGLPTLVPGVGPDDVGTAAGLVLATAFVATLIVRALIDVDGRASLLELGLLAAPGLGGVVVIALRWPGNGRNEVEPEAAVGRGSGETE